MSGKKSMHSEDGISEKNDSTEEKLSNQAETAVTGGVNIPAAFNMNALPEDLKKDIICTWLTYKETVRGNNAAAFDRNKCNTLFKPALTELEEVRDAAYHVLTGRPEHLIWVLRKNPMLFFKKCSDIRDAAGQIFHNVSPADLIDFVWDDDMQNQVATFASELPLDMRQSFGALWEKQRASRGRGGSDLVKLTRDPMTMPFKDVLESTKRYDAHTISRKATFSLLKNPDGIIYYLDPDTYEEHWYYANKDNETIEPIEISASVPGEHRDAYNQLKWDMDNMVPDSARRSSNQEHLLIQALIRNLTTNKSIQLVREGIHYTQDGIEYRDTHYDFNRMYNVYRKYFRLYNSGYKTEADTVLYVEHAHRIREVMCVVQRLCEENRPFFPDANFSAPVLFNRSFNIKSWRTGKLTAVFDARTGVFHDDFGSNGDSGFSIYKGMTGCGSVVLHNQGGRYAEELNCDLIAIHKRMEDAKRNMDEFEPNLVLSRGPSI